MKPLIMKPKYCLLIVFLGWMTFTVFPANRFEFLQHNMWTIEDGLPINSTTSIIQASDGYLWIGTEAGLVRFDGVEFEVFNHENVEVFTGALVSALLEDDRGTIWIATRGDGVIRYRDGRFDSFKESSGLLSDKVWCLMKSLDGSIWIGSKGGINRFYNEKLTAVPLPETLSSHWVSCMVENPRGRIWVGTNRDGLLFLDPRDNDFEVEYIGPPGEKIITLLEDRKSTLWIGTIENGLIKYQENTRQAFTTENGLSSNFIQCLFEDHAGNLWIGSFGGGINFLPTENMGRDKGRIIFAFPRQQEFSSRIYCIFQDREGTMWIGTLGDGLNSLRDTKIHTYTSRNGLSSDNVYGVFQDSTGRLWTGSRDKGVNYLKAGQFYNLTKQGGLSSDAVVSITESHDGALWFATLGGGINRYKNGRMEVFDRQRGLASNFYRVIMTDAGGETWAGSIDGNIYRWANDTFIPVADVHSRVNTIFKDTNGTLWAGTFDSGLCRIDISQGKVEVFDKKKGLSNDTVLCIHEDERQPGLLWLGTGSGLNRFRDGTFSLLRKKNGLADDTVYWILEDHKNDFWISSNRGIFRLKRKELDDFFNGKITMVQPSVYGKENGMYSIECNGGNHPAGWKTKDGKLWFPTTHGLSVVDPINLGVNNIPPPVVIKRIIVNGREIPAAQTVQIPAGKNDLEFHYTALSFIVPKKIRFKFKLEGYDNDWQNTSERSIRYTNLAAGTYQFRVIACNSDGVWNETGASVRLELKSKFYQTAAFIIFFLVGVIIIAFIVIFLNRYTRNHNLRLQSEQRSSRSKLAPDQTNQCVKKILYLLEVEKVYKEPNLSIKSLSSKLVISQKNLSVIINDQLNTNFFDLITEYRLKETQRLLTDPKTRDKSIIDIASEVGYNSKSAFNRAFKNFTGMTPSQFKKNDKKSGQGV